MSFRRSVPSVSIGTPKWFLCVLSTLFWVGIASAQIAPNSGQASSSAAGAATSNVSDPGQPSAVVNENPDHNAELPSAPSSSKPGSVSGTILDQSGAVSVGTVVRLTMNGTPARQTTTGTNGEFSFSNVPPGSFQLSTGSSGFSNQAYSGDLDPGQVFLVPPIVLSVATVVTDVRVTDNQVEVATEQVHEQIEQRVLGFVPNFFVTYHPDAPPLTTKLKFELAWKSSTDPINIFGVAFLAGIEQAGDQYGEFGQGMQGYGKRFGAGYGDVVASTFLSGAVFPTLFKQDPRYFYQGTGSTKSRILHAASNSVWARSDSGKWQVNYSNIAGVIGGAAIASTMYPSTNQGRLILSQSLIRMGESSLAGVFQEFVAKKLTKVRHRDAEAP